LFHDVFAGVVECTDPTDSSARSAQDRLDFCSRRFFPGTMTKNPGRQSHRAGNWKSVSSFRHYVATFPIGKSTVEEHKRYLSAFPGI
jgi:hypothetical protein